MWIARIDADTITARTITELPPSMDLAILERLIEEFDAATSCAAAAPQAWSARLRSVGERDAGSPQGFVHAKDADPRAPLPWLI